MLRFLFYIGISVFVIIGIFYFAGCYLEKDIKSLFTFNQNLMLIVIFILVLITSIVLICLSVKFVFLSRDFEKLSQSFYEFIDTVIDVEDNLAQCSRTTQELILDLIDKFGVDSNGEKS